MLKNEPTESATGGKIDNWVVHVSKHPAFVHYLEGRDLYAAQQVIESASIEVSLRYLAQGLTSDMRINHDGTLFEILVPPRRDPRNWNLTVLCSEVVHGP